MKRFALIAVLVAGCDGDVNSPELVAEATHTTLAAAECGGDGQPCCDNYACNVVGSGCVVNGDHPICEPCGKIGDRCCDFADTTCSDGTHCAREAAPKYFTDVCDTCGYEFGPCCPGSMCHDPDTVCMGGTICLWVPAMCAPGTDGTKGRPCYRGWCCDDTLKCVSGIADGVETKICAND